MRRERDRSSSGSVDGSIEADLSLDPPSSTVVSVMHRDYHMERVVAEGAGELWAYPVYSAPYRRTRIRVVLPHDYNRRSDQYALSEDGLVFADPNR